MVVHYLGRSRGGVIATTCAPAVAQCTTGRQKRGSALIPVLLY